MSIFKRGLLAGLVVVAWALAAPLSIDRASAAEEPFKQVQLDEATVKNFIVAQKEMAEYHQKLGPGASDKPDPKIQADLEALAKKHGFATFGDFDDVAFNISMVMGGLDPQTGQFTDPITAINREIEEIKNDKSIPEKDKKQMLDELAEALKSTAPLKFPGNVEVVKRNRADIEKVLQ